MGKWVDAKLNEFTVYRSDSLKYLQHCRLLEIVYLNGLARTNPIRSMGRKLRLLPVDSYFATLRRRRKNGLVKELQSLKREIIPRRFRHLTRAEHRLGWSPQKVIAEIRRRKHAGKKLDQTSMSRADPALLNAGFRHFGSWGRAIRAAGMNHSQFSRRGHEISWSRKLILSKIRSLYRQGHVLTRNRIYMLNPALVSSAANPKFFGNWGLALRAAGIPVIWNPKGKGSFRPLA